MNDKAQSHQLGQSQRQRGTNANCIAAEETRPMQWLNGTSFKRGKTDNGLAQLCKRR
ncbi:MAG: hypothetical protein V7K47_21395 [Nostoc sp.]